MKTSSKSNVVTLARTARAPKVIAKAPAVRAPLPLYKAPADFKPYFALVQVTTEKDGLIATKVQAVRYQGRFDRDVEDKKKFNMAFYDRDTIMGIATRLAAVTYKASNDKKLPASIKARAAIKGGYRLPASTTFQLLMRAGKKTADESLTCRVTKIWQMCSTKSSRIVPVELEKTDPAYRALRKASRILPAAFTNTQLPPKRTRGSQTEAE